MTNARWFYGKKRKIGKQNLDLTKTQLGKNEMWCVTDNHIFTCHICAKGFYDTNFNSAVIDKISKIHEVAPNVTYSQKSYFLKYIWNLLDQLLLPYKFYGRDMYGMYFFIFASCEPLSSLIVKNRNIHCLVLKKWNWLLSQRLMYLLFLSLF